MPIAVSGARRGRQVVWTWLTHALALLLIAALLPASALADDDEADEAEPPPPRPVPDYDGRGEPPTTAGDVLLWIPRVLVSPLYLVSEYVIRRPLGWLVTTAEQNDWPRLLVDFFTFGPDASSGIIPTALVEFDMRPSVGFYYFWDDFLVEGNDLRVHLSFWGFDGDWLRLTLRDQIQLAPDHQLGLRFILSRRPDYLYYGVGPESRIAYESRFSMNFYETGARYQADLWRESSLTLDLGPRWLEYQENSCCDDPSIQTRVVDLGAGGVVNTRTGALYDVPAGFDRGYQALLFGAAAALDTRTSRPKSESGIRLAARAQYAYNFQDARQGRGAPDSRLADDALVAKHWINYSGSAGAYLDLGRYRVLGLTSSVYFADPLGDGQVPFSELVWFGGRLNPMRGYREGRLMGRSGAVLGFEYRWPIWVWLDGELFADVGNVFDAHLQGFELERLRYDFGLGFRAVDEPDSAFEFIVGFGSQTFDQGGEIDMFRLVFGVRNGI